MSVLIIATSATKMGDHTTGAWHEEIAGPYKVFTEAGLKVDIASIKGGEVPIDATSIVEGSSLTEYDTAFMADEEAMKKLKGSLKLEEAKVAEYDIIFLSGGHGTCVDYPEGCASAVSESYAAGKVVAAVCHGSTGLVNANAANGDALVKGKTVSCFSDVEEGMVGLTEKVPYSLEKKMVELGAKIDVGGAWGSHCVVDERLVTGQNPGSSVECAKLALKTAGIDVPREFDITIWSATGFTGSLVAEYFATTVSKTNPSIRWSIAGRNREKLDALAERISTMTGGAKPTVQVGSVTDQASIDSIVGRTRVVISVSGTFVKFGKPIVDACVRLKTHYTDTTGETPWVRRMMDQYNETAESNGVYVVPMCGFDSIPSDLGSYFTAQQVALNFKVPVQEIRAYYKIAGGPSGGTLESGNNMKSDPVLNEMFLRPFLLGGGDNDSDRAADQNIKTADFNKDLGVWTAPFGMAECNTRVARRSASEHGDSMFSKDYSFNECKTAANEEAAKKAETPPSPAVLQALMDKGILPKPGTGPTVEMRAKSYFGVLFVGKTEDGRELIASMKGGDPGYTETSKMVAECALLLALGHVEKARKGGVLTPSLAFGDSLVTSLAKAGLELKVEKVGKAEPEELQKVLESFVPSKPEEDDEKKN